MTNVFVEQPLASPGSAEYFTLFLIAATFINRPDVEQNCVSYFLCIQWSDRCILAATIS